MSWLARGLGSFGSDLGAGYDIAQNWRMRDFDMRMQQARQKMAEAMMPLQLQQLQEEIARSQYERTQPKNLGVYPLRGGGYGVAMEDPTTHKSSMQEIYKGVGADTGIPELEAMLADVPPERQHLARGIIDSYKARGQYSDAEFDKTRSALTALGTKPEPRPYSPEQDYIEQLQKERQAAGKPPLTSEELRKAHEAYQPYGAQRLQIQLGNLNERRTQDVITDIAKLEALKKPYEHLINVSDQVPGYVANPNGPGDVALLSAFVEASKPQVGFRWTQQEVDLIKHSTSWIGYAQARLAAGYQGTLFEPQQRQFMGNIIMKAAGQSADLRDQKTNEFLKARPELRNFVDAPAPAVQPGGDPLDNAINQIFGPAPAPVKK